jgi:hypothetical protein
VRYLLNQEFLQLHLSFVTAWQDNRLPESSDKVLTGLMTKYQKHITLFQAALKEEKDKEAGKEISRLDKERDNCIRAVLDSIKPYRNTLNLADKEAYDVLNTLFGSFSGIQKLSSERQTGAVNQLLGRLSLTKYSQAVRQLGIGKFVTALQDCQNRFVAKSAEKKTRELNQVKVDLSATRADLETVYRQLLTYVAIMAEVTEKADYTKLFKILTQSRRYYIDLVSRRRKKK